MSNWSYIGLLHNLSLGEAVGNRYVAIAPETDARVIALTEASQPLKRLVSGFTDQFQRPASPSLLILHPNAPKRLLAHDALIGFRNAVAISSIIRSWEEGLVKRLRLNALKYSNYFDLYPISVSKNDEAMVTSSPSLLGMDDPKQFAGQTSPELASRDRVTDFFDVELLNAILSVWEKRFPKHGLKDWRSRVLFRSLEMAFHASTFPFKNSSTIYDYGANIALWVSAFEVLVRSATSRADLPKVLGLLDTTKLNSRKLNRKLYTVTIKGKKREVLYRRSFTKCFIQLEMISCMEILWMSATCISRRIENITF